MRSGRGPGTLSVGEQTGKLDLRFNGNKYLLVTCLSTGDVSGVLSLTHCDKGKILNQAKK